MIGLHSAGRKEGELALQSTIPVADDKLDIVNLILAILEREGRHLVTTALGGEEALRKVEANNMSFSRLEISQSPTLPLFSDTSLGLDVDDASILSVYEASGDVNGQ